MIRARPSEPYNELELARISERQNIVRRRVYHHIRESAPIFHVPVNGPTALFHQLMIARAAMNPKNVLYRKQWREIAWELRFPPAVIHKHYDGGSRTGFIVTQPQEDAAWTFTVSAIQDFSHAAVGTLDDVLEWLGLIGGEGGYPGHHDPFWTPASGKERVGEKALIWDRTDISDWNTDANADAWDATSTWWPAMIGAAYWLAEDATRRIVVGSETLRGDKAVNWVMDAINAWSSPRAFYDVVQSAVKAAMTARQLCVVNSDGSLGATASAVTGQRWTTWRFTTYNAAVTEGRRLT